MKKLTVLLLAVMMLFSTMSIFANGNTEKTEGPVEISYISSTILESPEGKIEQALVDKYNETHPNVVITPIGVGSNDLAKKYVALATSNDLPDFFMVHDAMATNIIDLGVAAPLKDIFPAEFLAQFSEPHMTLWSKDGEAYGLPWFACPPGVIYRKDIFDAAGVQVPTTWDELTEAAVALTKDGNYGITLVGTKNASGGSRFQHVIRNFGVDEFYQDANGKWCTDIGSENYIRALRTFCELDTKYHAVPAGVIETGYPEAVGLFSSGRAAMLITGSNAYGAITSQVPELVGKLGSFPVPAEERFVACPNGSAWYVNKDSKHLAEVADFLMFLCNEENSTAFAEATGRVPAMNLPADHPAKQNPALAGFLESLKSDYAQPTISGYNEIHDIIAESYQNVFTGMSVEDAAAKAQARAQAVCDKANK